MAPRARRSLEEIPENAEAGEKFIPEDLLVKILEKFLLCLPTREVSCYQFHIKAAQSLIRSDVFRLKHAILNPTIERSMILSSVGPVETFGLRVLYFDPVRLGGRRIKDYEIPISESGHCFIFHGSNGLLLLRHHSDDLIQSSNQSAFSVYNPTTRCTRIVSIDPSVEYSKVVELSILFNPRKSPYYKVVCVRAKPKNRAPFEFKFDIYCSESSSWTELGRSSGCPRLTGTTTQVSTGVGLGNVVLWRINNGYFYLDTVSGITGNVQFPVVQFPRTRDATTEVRLVEASDGRLYHCALIKGGVRGEGESLHIWEMGANFEWLHRYTRARLYSVGVIIGVIMDEDWECLITYDRGILKSYSLTFDDKYGSALADLRSYLEFYASDKIIAFKFGETMAPV